MNEAALALAISDLITLGNSQQGTLMASQLRERLSGFGTEELLEALKTLKKQGITVEAPQVSVGEAEEDQRGVRGTHRKKAGEEEKRYAARTLDEMMAEGALPLPMQGLMARTLALAEEYYCEEILWEDLVQEACIALFTAMGEAGSEEEMLSLAEKGIAAVLEERVSEKQGDMALIEKVEKLEEAVRELNDGEGEKFTIAELAVILDMDPEDIHGILRLTGDDDGQSGE